MSPPPRRPKEGSALQAAPSRDATPLRSVHPRAGGDGAADLSPLGGKARSAKGAPVNGEIRVPLVEPGTRPELAGIESRIMAERGRVSTLYRVLLNSPPVAEGWERMLTAIRNRTLVPADLRELIILRVAVLNRASFEFDAHVPHARQAGLSEEKIEAVRQAAIAAAFGSTERLVLELADAMTRDVDVPAELMDRLQAVFDDRLTVEVVATVAAYNMVSRFLVALDVGHK